MGFIAMVGAAISSVGSAISSAVSSIGGAISSGVKSFSESLIGTFPKLEEFHPIKTLIDVIKSVVSAIAEMLGLKKSDETAEEIGFKAENCEKKPKDFESNEEYIKYIREEVKLDKEKFDKLTEEEKAAYSIAGLAILTKGVEEKTNIIITPEFLYCTAKLSLSGAESYSYINAFKEGGFRSMQDMTNYLKGNYSNINVERVSDVIEQTIRKNNPGISDDDVQNKIRDMKINMRES